MNMKKKKGMSSVSEDGELNRGVLNGVKKVDLKRQEQNDLENGKN